MNLGEARALLRVILGEASASVWSDSDLDTLLKQANKTIWRAAVAAMPSSFVQRFEIIVPQPTDSTGKTWLVRLTVDSDVDSFTDGSSGVKSVTGRTLLSVDRVYEHNTVGDRNKSVERRLVTMMHSRRALGTGPFEDLPHVQALERPQVRFVYGEQGLHMYPPLTKETEFTIYGVPEEPGSIPSGDASVFMDGMMPSAHRAIVFEAAYVATFKDKSLREDFAAERDRTMAVIVDVPVSTIESD